MLSAPPDLPEELLVAALNRGWGLRVDSLVYRPVGFGSHHWTVVGGGGVRYFVSVDELETKRHAPGETLDTGFDRLGAALRTARRLRDGGFDFVVAPLPAHDGGVVLRVGDRFAVAVYPYIQGQSFAWGDFATTEHRRVVLEMIIGLHSAPADVTRSALVENFPLPHRDELEAALGPTDEPAEQGPYTAPAMELIAANAPTIRTLLRTYDALAYDAQNASRPRVLTHGEPHPGNTMLAADGRWLLIDWDTALLAPPERDLWRLDPGDGSALAAYADATGVTPNPSMLWLYRLGWDLADLAAYVNQFRSPHLRGTNEEASWAYMRHLIGRLEEMSQRPVGMADTTGR
jgi:spectinomycin phosphotransferase